MGWGCLGTDVLLPHLGFYLVPAQLPLPLLPLWGSAPLTGASACLTPVCWSTPGVVLEGVFAAPLGFLPFAVLTLCQGAPVAVIYAWFAGEVTLLPFPYLRVGMILACGVSAVCGLRRRSRLPFVVRHGLGFVACILWLLVGPGT